MLQFVDLFSSADVSYIAPFEAIVAGSKAINLCKLLSKGIALRKRCMSNRSAKTHY
jgi:hypothetical protein